MKRTSDKHGPRVDEGLKEETSPPSAAAPDETPPGSIPDSELERRQELGRFVERKFPATREEIIQGAAELDAPLEVITQLERLPERTYEGFPEVWEALGGRIEGGRRH